MAQRPCFQLSRQDSDTFFHMAILFPTPVTSMMATVHAERDWQLGVTMVIWGWLKTSQNPADSPILVG